MAPARAPTLPRALLRPRFWASAMLVAGRASAAEPSASAGAGTSLPCPLGTEGALTELSCELARPLGSDPGAVLVTVGPPAGGATLENGPALSSRFARLLTRALGSREAIGVASGPPRGVGPQPRIRARVTLEVAGGRVRAALDAEPMNRGFWDRVRDPSPAPLARAAASRPIDGEIGAFLPKVRLRTTRVDRASLPTSDVVALACGDVNADERTDVVVVGRRKIVVGRAEGGRFVSGAEVPWTALSPVAPSPLREPVASVRIHDGLGLDVGLTDRAHGVRLSPSLEARGVLDDVVPWEGVGCLGLNGVSLGLPGPCQRGEVSRVAVGEVSNVDTVAGDHVVRPDGTTSWVAAFRTADGTAVLRDSRGRSATVPGVGAALAVADVDHDGAPELLSSEDSMDPEEDALVVRSWAEDGSVKERFRLPVPEGVHAVAACPPEDPGQAPIVVATGRELWIVR